MTQKRPEKGDYAVYFEKYIALVPSGDFLEILKDQHEELIRRLTHSTRTKPTFVTLRTNGPSRKSSGTSATQSVSLPTGCCALLAAIRLRFPVLSRMITSAPRTSQRAHSKTFFTSFPWCAKPVWP